MGFLGIYRAIYDYTPKENAELAITTGDLLYILEQNNDDGWWKAKKKAGTDDEDEPIGLIPNNYVVKVKSILTAGASRLPSSRPRLDALRQPPGVSAKLLGRLLQMCDAKLDCVR